MREILASLADLVFPPRCSGCQAVIAEQDDLNFCAACRKLIRRILSPLCSLCGIPFISQAGEDHLCGECRLAAPPFFRARSWARYETVLREAIHQFKYGGQVFWGGMLGRAMARATYPGFAFSDYSLVIPVPLHKKRLRERGFNQSLLLARVIAQTHCLELDFASLTRRVHTLEQTTLDKEERERNVRRAFEVKDNRRIKGRHILLIDDVYTTGSTIRECCRTLTEARAACVAVLTAARAV